MLGERQAHQHGYCQPQADTPIPADGMGEVPIIVRDGMSKEKMLV